METAAAIVFLLWGIGIAVLVVSAYAISKEGMWNVPPSPVSALLLAMAIVCWPVTIPPVVYALKKKGEI